MAARNNKLTVEEIVKELDLKVDALKKNKFSLLLNKIYQKEIPPKEAVLNTILKIVTADPELSAVDDIYIIVYNGTIKIEQKYTFWPKKLIEYGVFKLVDAYVVREGEDFQISIDNGKTEIKHTVNPFNTDNKIIGAYARGVLPNGEVVISTANLNELKEAQKAAKIKSKGKHTVWDTWFDEVAKKVPLKRLVKMIPVPESLRYATEIDNENYATIEEIEKSEKVDSTYEAIEELNQEVEKKVTLQMALDDMGVEYELKKGYVKVSKKDIPEELIDKLKLTTTAKLPDHLVGKAQSIVEYEISEEEDIVYEPVENK